MAKAKKYRYLVSNNAEGTTYGYIELTKKEAAIVDWATNESNWKDVVSESWSGIFLIDVDDPQEIPEK